MSSVDIKNPNGERVLSITERDFSLQMQGIVSIAHLPFAEGTVGAANGFRKIGVRHGKHDHDDAYLDVDGVQQEPLSEGSEAHLLVSYKRLRDVGKAIDTGYTLLHTKS